MRTVGVAAAVEAGEIYVIANKSGNLSSVTVDQVKHLFLDESKLVIGGVSYQPIDAPPGSEARKVFYERVASRSPVQMKSYWARMVFTGKALPPQAAESDSEIEQIVAKDASKIGYVSIKPTNPNVQIIQTVD